MQCQRPSHPAPTFVTTAKRPLSGTGRLESLKLFLANRETKYFLQAGWTGFLKICPTGKSVASRAEDRRPDWQGEGAGTGVCSLAGYATITLTCKLGRYG
jgi:hypothetical protein